MAISLCVVLAEYLNCVLPEKWVSWQWLPLLFIVCEEITGESNALLPYLLADFEQVSDWGKSLNLGEGIHRVLLSS